MWSLRFTFCTLFYKLEFTKQKQREKFSLAVNYELRIYYASSLLRLIIIVVTTTPAISTSAIPATVT